MAAIEPGESFVVEYGSGKRVSVVALSIRGQRLLANVVKKLISAEANNQGLDLFDLADEALAIAMPDAPEELRDTIDAEMAIEIATKTLGKQSLSEDEQKKSE